MQLSAAQIAQLVQGSVEGNPDSLVNNIAKIEQAQESDLCFFANPKYEKHLYQSNAGIILINKDYQLQQPLSNTLIRVQDAYGAFAQLLRFYQQHLEQANRKRGIEQPSCIDPTAIIGEEVYIGAFSYVGKNTKIGKGTLIYPNVFIGDDCTIEENTVLYAGVRVYKNTIIGNNVIIHANTVIGADGFGFAPQVEGTYQKVPQLGNVVIEDNVEIGANTTIDRATIGSTMIRKGVKLDNLVQVAHNVELGANTVVAAQAGISGSTHIGKNVMIGGQAGIVGHIHIADGTKINAQSGVSKAIKHKNLAVTGSPAFDYNEALRSQAVFKKLPELLKRIEQLEMIIKHKESDK